MTPARLTELECPLCRRAHWIIDSDYRGEILVLLWNTGDAAVELKRGERIAQLVVSPVARVEWAEAEALDPTARGAGGFGHTGNASRGEEES